MCCHPIDSGRQTCGRTSRGHTGGRSYRISLYRSDSIRLDTRRLNITSLLHRESKGKKGRRERSDELGNTKETPGVPTYLNNFPTTVVAPYWINQRLQSKMYNQTPSLHRNERHRCTSCAVSSNNNWEYEREDNPALRDKTSSPLKHPLQELSFNSKETK